MNNNWIQVRFEELVDFIQPTEYIVKSTEYNDNNKIPVLTAGKSFIKGYTNETEGVFEDIPCIIFDDFTTASQYVNFRFKVKSSAMKILVPACHLVNLKYVYYAMQVTKIKNDTHKRYWISDYSKKEIPFAPLNEQRRIVAKIEDLFSELDNAEVQLKEIQNQLIIYKQALLKHAFEGKLTEEWRKDNKVKSARKQLEEIQKERQKRYDEEIQQWKSAVKQWEKDGKQGKKPSKPSAPINYEDINEVEKSLYPKLPKGWVLGRVGEVADLISGFAFKSKDFKLQGDYKLIRMGNLYNNKLDLTRNPVFLSNVPEDVIKNFSALEDDILLTLTGTKYKRDYGYAIKLPKGEKNLLVNQRILCIRSWINKTFLLYSLQTKNFRDQFFSFETGGVNQGNVSSTAVGYIILMIPPLEEQKVITEILEKHFSLIENLNQSIKSSIQQSYFLRQSILKKAFSGELVGQDLNDEPAYKLLKKIKLEKEKYLENLHKKKKNTSKKNKKMSENLSIEEVLKSSESPMLAKDVWQQSKYKNSIEDFYDELKKIEHKIKEIKQDTESLLSLIEHADR